MDNGANALATANVARARLPTTPWTAASRCAISLADAPSTRPTAPLPAFSLRPSGSELSAPCDALASRRRRLLKKTEAVQAMKLAFRLPEARVYVERAAQLSPSDATLDQLIRRALRVFQERDFGDLKRAN